MPADDGTFLLLRADSGPAIGSGHVVRSLALAAAVPAARKLLLTAAPTDFVRAEAAASGAAVAPVSAAYPAPGDLDAALSSLAGSKNAWAVVDGYHFDAAYHGAMRRAGVRVLVIDDGPRLPAYDADLILDQNLGAEARRYPGVPAERQLLGTGYALLRRSFLAHPRPERRFDAAARRWLVSFGGADPAGATSRVLDALAACPTPAEIVAVVGPNNPRLGAIREAAARDARIRLETAADMPGLMCWAEAAVLGAGSSCWEAAYLALPFLAMAISSNQDGIAGALQASGAARRLDLGADRAAITAAIEALASDHAGRGAMSGKCGALVDGKGAERVAAAMRAI